MNIKPQKEYLNINPCSACLCVSFSTHTQSEACVMFTVFSLCHLTEDMNA